MKRANYVVLTTYGKIVLVAAAALVPVPADRSQAASSPKANHSAARWAPMRHILAHARREAMRALRLARKGLTTPVLVTILGIVPKALAHHVLQEIAHKAIVRPIKTVVRVRKVIALRVIARHFKIVARVLRVIVLRIRIVARAHLAHRMPTLPNSVAGMCPMVSIQAHV